MALKSAILKQPLIFMNKKALILTASVLALAACKSPYSDWKMPNVVRNNKPQPVKNVQETSSSSQVQPKFEKPKAPAPAHQVQPEFKKPEPIATPAPKPELKAPEPVVAPKPKAEAPEPVAAPAPKPVYQIQPEFKKPDPVTAPAAKPVQHTQPETKPEPVVVAPAPKPAPTTVKEEQKKISIAETALPNTQVQPTFNQPKHQSSAPRPVMTQAQKEKFPVMPGQNRALKRRR